MAPLSSPIGELTPAAPCSRPAAAPRTRRGWSREPTQAVGDDVLLPYAWGWSFSGDGEGAGEPLLLARTPPGRSFASRLWGWPRFLGYPGQEAESGSRAAGLEDVRMLYVQNIVFDL